MQGHHSTPNATARVTRHPPTPVAGPDTKNISSDASTARSCRVRAHTTRRASRMARHQRDFAIAAVGPY